MARVTDSFTDTDSTEITSHAGEGGLTWAYHAVSLDTAFILGNKLLSDNDPVAAFATIAYSSWVPSSPDYEVSADIVSPDLGVGDTAASTAIAGRMDTTVETYYAFRWRQSFTRWELLKVNNSTGAVLATSTANPPSANVSFNLRLNMRGPHIEGWLDGTLLLQAIDTSITDAGRAGVRLAHTSTSTTGWHLDNFQGFQARGDALIRRRVYPFFDDEEVNRFEFWPAVAAGVTHERSASIAATADIAASGEFFSVFERLVSITASATITTVSQYEAQRSVAIDAVATLATSAEFFSILERSASLSAVADISSNGHVVIARTVSVAGVSDITTSGIAFSVFEAAASLSAIASIESSAISFSVEERAAAVSATGAIEASGTRTVERAAFVTTTVTIEVSGAWFSVFERAVQVSVTATIESAAQFFSVFERQTTVDATATITTNRQVELQRQISLSTTTDITTSGQVIPPGAVEHERSVSLSAAGTIESAATFFSVINGVVTLDATALISTAAFTIRERTVAIATTAVISTNQQRDLLRQVAIDSAGLITVSGMIVSGGASTFERAVAMNATATITVNGVIPSLTPSSRTFVVSSARRTFIVQRPNRTYLVPAPDREETFV